MCLEGTILVFLVSFVSCVISKKFRLYDITFPCGMLAKPLSEWMFIKLMYKCIIINFLSFLLYSPKYFCIQVYNTQLIIIIIEFLHLYTILIYILTCLLSSVGLDILYVRKVSCDCCVMWVYVCICETKGGRKLFGVVMHVWAYDILNILNCSNQMSMSVKEYVPMLLLFSVSYD